MYTETRTGLKRGAKVWIRRCHYQD